MGFTVAVASAGAFTLVFDWSSAGPETSSCAYEGRNRGAHVRIFGVFTAVSLIVAVSSGWIFGSYTTFIPFGIVYWIALAIATYLLDATGHGLRSSTNFSDLLESACKLPE
jgi:hypothetical protein